MHMLRTWVEINLQALIFNLKRIRSLAKNCEVIGVVKADAYGHGASAITQTLAQQGVKTLAVANITEARIISKAVPRADILILGPLLPEEFSELIKNPRWMCTISNKQEIQALKKASAHQKKSIRIHLKLDTGMGRAGALPHELLNLYKKTIESKNIMVAGLFSHFSSAGTNDDESTAQLKKLRLIIQELKKRGFAIPPIHIQNSSGTLRSDASEISDYIRPGLSLYGIGTPLSSWKKRFGKNPLIPVLSWKTRIVLIRDVPAGTPISYNCTYRTKVKTKIAVLSSGYADGVFRKLSNRGQVLIKGKRCPILGRVTMDMTMVDISKVKNVKWGDTAVLIGKSGQDEINAHEFSKWAETNPYEVLCNISKRVPRVLLKSP